MKISNNKVIGLVAVLLALGTAYFYDNKPIEYSPVSNPSVVTKEYNPVINPAEFTTAITNKYFALPVGKKLTFDAESDKGPEKIEIEITG